MFVIESGTTGSQVAKLKHVRFDTREFYLYKLEEILGTDNGQLLSFPDLIGRLRTIWTDGERQLVLERLEQMAHVVDQQGSSSQILPPQRRLPNDQQETMAQVLADLVGKAETLPARDRDRTDRAIARLSRLLSIDRAWSIVEPWFGDHRAFRRGVIVRVLLEYGVPPTLASGVIEQYRSTKDRGLLKLIGRNPHVSALFTEGDVLEALAAPEREWEIGPFVTPEGQIGPFRHRDRDACYWKMRAIEVLLIGGHVPSDAVAFRRPMEFVWAVGRQSHRASLPLLRRLLKRYQTDPEFVWRCTRAFDRMGDASDIQQIRNIAIAIVEAERARTLPAALAGCVPIVL